MKKEKIFLLDGNSFCYRAFYAIKELSNSKGFPTNAIYGVIYMLRKLIDEFDPGMMAVAFDVKGPTDRHKKFKEYKIHRKPMPDDLVLQMPRIKEVISANNIPVFELKGYEADDVIATLAEKLENEGMDVVVVTSDKDALQLINKNIKVLSPHMKENKIYDKDEVVNKYGVAPELMVELMALMGDASDNVPGVKGVGAVTAKKLIVEYGNIEGLYEKLDKIKSDSLRSKLEEGREDAFLSRELVTLNRELPIEIDVEDLKMTEPDRERLTELYKEFEFRALLKEIIPQNEERSECVLYKSSGDILKLQKDILKQKEVAVRLFADPSDNIVSAVAFSWKKGKSHFVNLKGDKGGTFLKNIFEDEKVGKIGHDLKSDIVLLGEQGINCNNIIFDVMIADYLLEPSLAGHDLPGIVLRRLGYKINSSKSGVKWDDSGQATLGFMGPEAPHEDICEEVNAIFLLHKELKGLIKEKKLEVLLDKVEMPLINVLAEMEKEGIGIDIEYLEKKSKVLDKDIKGLTGKIHETAGEEFNVNSPKQLQKILFEKLDLPVVKKTKTGPSTDESVLTRLSGEHELPSMVLEYRTLSKLKNTYYDGLLRLVDRDTRKLHTNFNQAITSTGRLSSSEPNLQNIPIRTELGREIRRAFIAGEPGEVLIAADYSQVELRILAHLSGDPNLIKAFENDEDIHKYTASLVFDADLDEVDGEMRSIAKTVNFGIIYGMGPFSLAKDLGVSLPEAHNFIDSYFSRYKGVKKFIDKTLDAARKDGYVTTILNRRRYIPEINSTNHQVKGFAERAAMNTPVQGSAADLIKLAMIKCADDIEGSKMILQVHDELIFTLPEKRVEEAAVRIKQIMENVIDLKVPLKVDLESGKNWMEMDEISL